MERKLVQLSLYEIIHCNHQPAIYIEKLQTEKQVKLFSEAENTEIKKLPAQSPDVKLTENLWKMFGEKMMANKTTTVSDE